MNARRFLRVLSILLTLMFLQSCSNESEKPPEAQLWKPPEARSPAQAEPEKLPEAQLGKPIRVGNLEITPEKIEFRKVEYGPTDDKEIAGPFLVLTLKMKNLSEGEVFSPSCIINAKDNYKNELDQAFQDRDFITPDGSEEHKDLEPGKQAMVVLCMKRKIERASSYAWRISTKSKNADDPSDSYIDWVLRFKASDITTSD